MRRQPQTVDIATTDILERCWKHRKLGKIQVVLLNYALLLADLFTVHCGINSKLGKLYIHYSVIRGSVMSQIPLEAMTETHKNITTSPVWPSLALPTSALTIFTTLLICNPQKNISWNFLRKISRRDTKNGCVLQNVTPLKNLVEFWVVHSPKKIRYDTFQKNTTWNLFCSVDRNRTLKCTITTNPFVLVKRIGTAPWLRGTGANMLKHVWEHTGR